MTLDPLPRRYTRAEAVAMLEDLYAQLPPLECKGLCYDSCTVVDASELERQRIAEAGGDIGQPMSHKRLKALIADGHTPRCPALGPLNNCTVYAVRPMICRVFGMAEGLMCEHRCVPDGLISKPETLRLLAKIEQLSAQVTGVHRRWRPL